MADKIEVTVLRQKVFHDGSSMIVLKPGEDTVDPRYLIPLFNAGVIADPGKDELRSAAGFDFLGDESEIEGSPDDIEVQALRDRIAELETETADIATLRARVTELEEERDELLDELEEADKKLAAQSPPDNDGDGNPGGSAPQEPPALTGKNKADLLAIANAEGVTITEGATNAQIVESIEAARAAGDEDDAPPA